MGTKEPEVICIDENKDDAANSISDSDEVIFIGEKRGDDNIDQVRDRWNQLKRQMKTMKSNARSLRKKIQKAENGERERLERLYNAFTKTRNQVITSFQKVSRKLDAMEKPKPKAAKGKSTSVPPKPSKSSKILNVIRSVQFSVASAGASSSVPSTSESTQSSYISPPEPLRRSKRLAEKSASTPVLTAITKPPTSEPAIPKPTPPPASAPRSPPTSSSKQYDMCLHEIVVNAYQQIKELQKNFVFLVAGVKNVGKSTFTRTLMNRLLEKGLTVYHLECDPGQTEFTPPACLALTEVTERVNGLPFSHMRAPIRCNFFGEATPSNRMGDYVNCILKLLSEFKNITAQKGHSCLVMNTCGWLQGAGLAALLDICRAAEPDHVVLLRPISGANQTPKRRSGEATASAHESLVSTLSEIGRMKQGPGPATVAFSVVDGFTFASSGWIGDPNASALSREAALLSYFGHKITSDPKTLAFAKRDLSLKIRSFTPYVVPMKDVYVNVVHGTPPPTCILSILNASLVALCRYDDGGKDGRPEKHWLDDPTLPKILDENVANVQCLGFGVIRATDVEKRIFYLLTPEPAVKLSHVNAFLKGDISLPSEVFQYQQITHHGLEIPIQLPYLIRGKQSLELNHDHLVLHQLDSATATPLVSMRKRLRKQKAAEVRVSGPRLKRPVPDDSTERQAKKRSDGIFGDRSGCSII